MLRASLLPMLAVLVACGPKPSAPTTPPDDATATAAAALDGEIVETAINATTVQKMKVRVDGSGSIVKQSVYHDRQGSIPAPVLELAKSRFPGATVRHYETELYADRGRVYEVEVDDGGKLCEVAATPAGQEVYTECQVDPTTLAAEVMATIEKVAPGGKVVEAETKKGPEVDEITVEVERAGGQVYLRLQPNGTLIQAFRRIPAVVEVPLP